MLLLLLPLLFVVSSFLGFLRSLSVDVAGGLLSFLLLEDVCLEDAVGGDGLVAVAWGFGVSFDGVG